MQLSIALPTSPGSTSAALSLLGLAFNARLTFGVDRIAGAAATTYTILGSVDPSATGSSPNLTPLVTFSAPSGAPLPNDIGESLRGWPVLLVQAPGGGSAGTFYVEGDAARSTATPASITAPGSSGNGFSALLDCSAFGADGTRIAGSAALTIADVFDVYVFADPNIDPTVTGAAGGYIAGRIAGGGGAGAPSSAHVFGWPYAAARRISGSTAGSILAAGVVGPSATAAPASLIFVRNLAATLADVPPGGVIGTGPDQWTVLHGLSGTNFQILSSLMPAWAAGAGINIVPTVSGWIAGPSGQVSIQYGTDANAGQFGQSNSGSPSVFAVINFVPVSTGGGTRASIKVVTAGGDLLSALSGGALRVSLYIVAPVPV